MAYWRALKKALPKKTFSNDANASQILWATISQ
jgi:hypothetical protein